MVGRAFSLNNNLKTIDPTKISQENNIKQSDSLPMLISAGSQHAKHSENIVLRIARQESEPSQTHQLKS